MALTKVRGGAIDNPLTLGGGSASDNSIIFDGNAQDFHIGLDDSSDSLTIGLGSTLGTTSHMVIDANGIITKPLQPAFLIRSTSNQDNISTNTNVYPAFNSEVFDNNADATVSTGDGQGGDASNVKAIFTAPVTGKYQLNVILYFYQVPSDTSYLYVLIKTSNREYIKIFDTGAFDSTADYFTFNNAVLADMDASDTAEIVVQQVNGTQSLDILGNATHGHTSFSGYLVC